MFKKMLAAVQIMGLFLVPTTIFGYETTATLNGHVKEAKGGFVSGASITVKHEPTGFVTTGQTNSKGIFVILNLKVGDPYTIKISFIGYKDEVFTDVNLGLGSNPDVSVTLTSTATVLTEVTVSAAGRKQIVGATTIGARQLATLPTLGRSLSDFA